MSEVITVLISLLTFLLGGVLVYLRENKKLFQEKIFEYKYVAYTEVLERVGEYYEDVFSFLQEFQDFKGSESEWEDAFCKSAPTYYKKSTSLDVLLYKHMSILPEMQLTRLSDIIDLCTGHVTNHSHYKSSYPHDSHDRLWVKIMEFANAAREDLKTDVLNATLNKRLSNTFYPIDLPIKNNSKDKNVL